MNQRGAVKTFSRVKPRDIDLMILMRGWAVSPADFKTVDMPPATDRVPPVTPWK